MSRSQAWQVLKVQLDLQGTEICQLQLLSWLLRHLHHALAVGAARHGSSAAAATEHGAHGLEHLRHINGPYIDFSEADLRGLMCLTAHSQLHRHREAALVSAFEGAPAPRSQVIGFTANNWREGLSMPWSFILSHRPRHVAVSSPAPHGR